MYEITRNYGHWYEIFNNTKSLLLSFTIVSLFACSGNDDKTEAPTPEPAYRQQRSK